MGGGGEGGVGHVGLGWGIGGVGVVGVLEEYRVYIITHIHTCWYQNYGKANLHIPSHIQPFPTIPAVKNSRTAFH